MKYVKMLGLLAVAAAALMAFAGTAAATTVTSSEGSTPTIKAKAGTTELHAGDGSSFLTVKCEESTVEGKVETHGESVTASGNIPKEKLTFSKCGEDVVTVLAGGSLIAHTTFETTSGTSHQGTNSNNNGTLTSTGAEIRIHTRSGPVCTFKTNATDIGTLTGGKNATLDINSATIPASGFLCPSTGVWTGSYTVTSPSEISVH